MYGITEEDMKKIDQKIERQINYLKDNNLTAIGANVAPDKYLAELNNRVNALTKIAFESKLKPVFITITLPSYFHPSSTKYRGYTLKECNVKLTNIWRKILRSRVLLVSNYHYIQTKEPHKSGVPHLHAVFYIEERYLDRFRQVFENEMKRQDIKRYEFKTEFKSDKYSRKISAVVAYILKYIFKSFKNSKTGKMSLTSYWYVKHNIRRVTMSRSLIPLRVYRRIHYKNKFQDMYKATKDWFNGRILESGKRWSIGYLSADDFHNIFEEPLWIKDLKLDYMKVKSKPLLKRIAKKVFDIKTMVITPAYMKDHTLYNYYYSLDPEDDKISLLHFGITQNEMIARGLLKTVPINKLDDFNTNFDLKD